VKRLPEAKRRTPTKPLTSLAEVVEDLDISVTDQLKRVLDYLDERFVQGHTRNKDEYVTLLQSIRDELEETIGQD
jgi:hypothetical protein